MEEKEESVLFKEKGNQFYMQGRYADAIEAFTKSIVSTKQSNNKVCVLIANQRNKCNLLQ